VEARADGGGGVPGLHRCIARTPAKATALTAALRSLFVISRSPSHVQHPYPPPFHRKITDIIVPSLAKSSPSFGQIRPMIAEVERGDVCPRRDFIDNGYSAKVDSSDVGTFSQCDGWYVLATPINEAEIKIIDHAKGD
jgi:hypothetical protein